MKIGKFIFGFIAILAILVLCAILYRFLVNPNNSINEGQVIGTQNMQNGENTQNQNITNVQAQNVTNNVQIIDTEKFVIGKREAVFTEGTYPRIDGSTATIPLSEAFKAEFLGKDLNSVSVDHNTTHYAYENLINGKADLILVTYPSEEEQQMAKNAGIELEIIPVVNEAFVFYTNKKNTVKSLTLEQVRRIYTGEITNWKEVGGKDLKIKAYQREPNSGSQTGMLKLVMGNLQLMEAPKEDIVESMSEIIGLVSDYENGENSIGYSYYYYATTMYDTIDKDVADRIQLLGINNVEPNNTTIKNGTYPIRTNYYIVINKAEAENSNTRKLVNLMLSDRGQKTAEAVGYVGIK